MSSKVQIQNANLLKLIGAAHDAGVAPGTPLATLDKAGKLVELSMSGGIKVTFEILNDDDPADIKRGYGLTTKDGACTTFYQYVGINIAFEEVHYGGQGYKKVGGTKWIKPGKPINDEAIRRNQIKGDWLKQPEFLVDAKDADGNDIKKARTELGVMYSYINLKPDTLCILHDGAVVAPKTPPKSAAKAKTPSAPKKKKASKTTAPKKKTTKPPSNTQLKNIVKGKCPTGPKRKIQEYILTKCTVAQLEKVHARYYHPVAPRKGGKEPNMGVTAAILRNELREVWGM